MVSEFEVVDNLIIKTNDRVSIFGKTGSGKTFLAKNWILPHYIRYIFWDIQHMHIDVEHDIVLNTPKELKKNIDNYRRILYQPKIPSDSDFNEICKIIFEHKDISLVLYVDEAAVVTTPTRIQYWHKVIMTQGRSYNIGIINVSQRPRDIHNTLISESEHLFVFTLNLETDIIKIKQQIGDAAEEIRPLPEHHFLYHNITKNKSYVFKPVRQLSEKKEISKLELYRPSLEEYLMFQVR